MARDPVDWLEAVFDDLGVRLKPALLWKIKSTDLPITVEVKAGEGPRTTLLFNGEDLGDAVIRLAGDLQAWLVAALGAEVPPCPTHRGALSPARTDALPEWRCPEGDLNCLIGDYRDAIWPPGPDERPGDVAAMLGRRLTRRGLREFSSWSAKLRDGGWVAEMDVRPNADEAAIRAAAAPIAMKFTHVGPVITERYESPATGSERAFRALTLRRTMRHLATLQGTLRRASIADKCDFLVEASAGRAVRVVLRPEHRIGPATGAVIIDAVGQPFARAGDSILCVGGFLPESHLEGETMPFSAGEIRVFE
ncbi:MAG: hypothetical protein WA751_08665 [Candidatus Dormiibacterota bacterium]